MVTSKKKWKGKSTLLLAIPLIALGVFMSWLVFIQMGYMYPSKHEKTQKVYQPTKAEKELSMRSEELIKKVKEEGNKRNP